MLQAWVYRWGSCASLWCVVSFMVWIELNFTSALTRWHWMLSSNPRWPLKALLGTYGELSVRMLKCHLTNQSAHLHASGDVSICACVCVCVIKRTCCMQCCQREAVFFCIDYGWIKQTLVRFVYAKASVSEQADQNILKTTRWEQNDSEAVVESDFV